MKSAFLVIMFLGSAFGQSCPRVDTVANLDLERFSGMWQIHGVVNTAAAVPEMSCFMSDFSSNDFDNFPVQIGGHLMYNDADGEMQMSNAVISADFPTAPGYWNWSHEGESAVAFVMFTDYVDYALILLCRGSGANYEAHFMGRAHDPLPAGVVDNFKERLEEYDVNLSSYTQIFHDHSCGH